MTYDGKNKRTQSRRKSVGRRKDDLRTVCIWHDVCHESMARIKQDQMDHREEHKDRDKMVDSKLDRWVFKLLVITALPFFITLVGGAAYFAFESAKNTARNSANIESMMHEFEIPVKAATDAKD